MATKSKDKSDANKEKQANFVKLANARVPKALKAISLIGNLGSSNYAHTEEQGKAVVEALRGAVDTVEKQLSGEAEVSAGFVLK